MHYIRKALTVLLITCAAQAACAADTRAVMHDVFEAIAYLLPRSLLERPFDGDDRELVQGRLAVLASASAALAQHADEGGAEFGLLARSFSRSTADIGAAFESGDPPSAYYALMNLTQHCAACHSRLPDAGNFAFGQRLMARMNVDALPPEDLAQLYVATRQFDKALGVLERIVMDPTQRPVDLDLAGILVEFLEIAISVHQEIDRPAEMLARFAERPDLPYYLQRRLGIWQSALVGLPQALAEAPTLSGGRALFEHATAMTPAPTGSERAVHDLVAASVLRKWLETAGDAPAAERAEALYLLGLIALRTRDLESSVPETELLFEAAIRTAPGTPLAGSAYALLEEHGLVYDAHPELEGDGGALLDMPALRALIDIE